MRPPAVPHDRAAPTACGLLLARHLALAPRVGLGVARRRFRGGVRAFRRARFPRTRHRAAEALLGMLPGDNVGRAGIVRRRLPAVRA